MNMVYDNKNMVYENNLTRCELFVKKKRCLHFFWNFINKCNIRPGNQSFLSYKLNQLRNNHNTRRLGGGGGERGTYYDGLYGDVLPKRCTFLRVEGYKV